MEKVIKNIRERAKQKNKKKQIKVLLPEANDLRILKATEVISNKGISKIILLGNPKKVVDNFKKNKIQPDFSNIEIIDPSKSQDLDLFSKTLFLIRKKKGLTKLVAKKLVKNPAYFSALMVKEGKADGVVEGATWPSADTWRSSLQVLKSKNDFASSSFLMIGKNGKEKRNFVFADCALNIDPNAKELAKIAIQSAKSYKIFVNEEPKVALLSFSTKGSGIHSGIKKIKDAYKIAKKSNKKLIIEGEVQVDAAIISSVSKIKCPKCTIKGDANVLVFPDLNSGNIGYKLVERFGNRKAIGPIIQGLEKPINDLSRGCSVEDIVNLVAITVLQVKK